MSQHTQEPWETLITDAHPTSYGGATKIHAQVIANGKEIASLEANRRQAPNARRIVACINGCAGLNPGAYRAVVEALKATDSIKTLEDLSDWKAESRNPALTQASGEAEQAHEA